MTLARSPTQEDGFSLVEVLVALSILAAVASLSFSAFTRTRTSSTPEAVGREVARMFQGARLRAIASRSTVDAVFDVAQKRISLSDGHYVMHLPDGMHLSLQTGQHLVESIEQGSIVFYSDGSSSGGKVEFKMNGYSKSQIDVPWTTGIARLRNIP